MTDNLPPLPELPPHEVEEWSESYITLRGEGWKKETVEKYAVDYARAALEAQRTAVPEVWKVEKGFRWHGDRQQHIPQLVVEFEPVSFDGPCDAKGWRDRDAVAAMLAAAPQPVAQPKCPTCNDNGLIGGPSFSDPGEGGAPCPACSPEKPMTAHLAAYFMRRFQHEEKMLGPNEQAALKFTIEALEAMEAQPVAQPSEPVVHQYGFARANLYLQTINESLDKQLEEVMAERDARDDVLASIAHLIGAEFTSAYGFSDLVSELEERLPVTQAKPEQAQPMTDAERGVVFGAAEAAMTIDPNLSWRHAIVNAVERHHGITASPKD